MTQSRPPAPPRRPPAPPGRPPATRPPAPSDATQQMSARPSAPPRSGGTPPRATQQAQPKGPQRPPGQPSMEEVINKANDDGYSDIHLGVGEKPRVRDRGEMMILEDYPITDEPTFWSWMAEIVSEQEIQQFKDTKELDTATQYDFARVRINVFDSLTGPSIVMRLIPLKILTMEQLRAPEVLRDISDAHKGLVLVTGPTGSGKSTTMAAMIDYINKEHAKHIITIEDPIEFIHKSRKSLVKHREVGTHTLLFDNALKAALREDPDLILVGEMRDRGTVNTALKAAQTGHLVMGTLHTNSAVKTIERILNLYSAEEQHSMRIALAESLVAIIAQGLCRTTDGKRAAFHDILINTETMKEYISKGQYEEMHELMMQSEYDGMTTMNKALYFLYEEGRITEETALEKSPTPNEMAQMLRGRI
ncbi:type IV pilus twitching motility protein PilT [Spirulina sp. 06S082]|uniref:type IV pilus twitching motility protein PilT n=1 Tax=Spirulina sp. 06S082 TaxID=3110248 RepID=UPI002B2109DB|nr:type IV pilus twitching motility protein PilT [Spirulina sp. 06S082]MEA5470504.1 type IV pilus twitching motility protein PilT [Spirulina sp. 06S082]